MVNNGLRIDFEKIIQWIPPQSRVLDLGCGDGQLLAKLQQQKRVTGYGLEINPDKVVESIDTGINVIHMDLDNLQLSLGQFLDQSFDYVIMSQTLQATYHPADLLEEIVRIGKTGIVTFPNFGYWPNRFQLFFQGKMPISKALPYQWYNTPNIHLCTFKDFEILCQSKNIQILDRTVVDFAHRKTITFMPNLFGEIVLYQIKSIQ